MSATDCVGVELIVPTLRVGMPQGTLRVRAFERDAGRPWLHSHAERGNDQLSVLRIEVIQHLVHRQFSQHDGMLNAQQGVALCTVQLPREIIQHHTR